MARKQSFSRRAQRLVLLLPVVFAILAWWMLAGRDAPPPSAAHLSPSPDSLHRTAGDETHVAPEPAIRPALLAARADAREPGAGPTDAAPPSSRAETGPGEIRGRVLSAAGDPVAGARVSVRPDPGGRRALSASAASLADAHTSDDGSFRLERVPPGTYAVWAEAEGYGPAWRRGIGTGRRVVLHLSAAGHLRVRVIGTDQSPVEGAEVRYVTDGYVRACPTGADGWTELRDLPAGPAPVIVRDADGNLAHATGGVTAGETTTLACVISEGVVVRGEVRDRKDDRPVQGALVRLAYRDRPDLVAEPVETDTEGRFEAGPVTPDGWGAMLVAEYDGFATGSIDLEPIDLLAKKPFVRIRLWRQAEVQGRVFDAVGFPVRGARVRWAQDAGSPATAKPSIATTDPRGRFVLPLPHAPNEHHGYAIAAEGPDGSFGAARVRGAGLPDEEIYVVLRGSGRLYGTVRDAFGQVCDGALVILEPHASGMTAGTAGVSESWARYRALAEDLPDAARLRTATSSDGAYVLKPVPTGEYRIRIEHLDDSVRLSRRVRIAQGETQLDLAIERPGSIAGIVVGPRGEAVAGARVTARPPRIEGGPAFAASAKSGRDGRFLLEGIRGAGAWRLMAHADGYAPASVEGVRGGAGGVEMRLAAGSTLEGAVLHGEQPFRGGFRVWLTPKRPIALGRVAEPGIPFRAGDGTFAIEAVPPGAFTLEVRSLDGRLAALPTPVVVASGHAPEPLKLHLYASGRLEGTVRSAETTEPLRGAIVALRRDDAAGRGSFRSTTARTNLRGSYVLRGIPPGRYRLTVLSPGTRPFEDEVEVSGGEANRRDLVLADAN